MEYKRPDHIEPPVWGAVAPQFKKILGVPARPALEDVSAESLAGSGQQAVGVQPPARDSSET